MNLRIQLSSVVLKAQYFPPSQQAHGNNKLAILLHPWSWLGGQMTDPVLTSLLEPLHSKNYHVLRYNSRGVGGSSGWPSLTGLTEGKDLEEIIQWAAAGNLNVSDITAVAIVGYSHGSLIASLCPPKFASLKISHILISYPLGPRSWLTMFHSSTYASRLKSLVNQPESHVLVIHGDRDEFTSQATYEKWVPEVQSPQTLILQVQGGSHFWRREDGDRLIEKIQAWLI
ncbi:alpha/beta-hydrolase [Dendrothele bispora CBS 962.96]|uniref:Alpha/beta-hydrolase n=1 Tax=Dendrothele bispora (strain CBS 962.96) TaxID=1314807 RepID=A0A4S8MKF4_DENBC|nr:alpha/beta-hydrolase [Dendrothele bispora CBS 962.96]